MCWCVLPIVTSLGFFLLFKKAIHKNSLMGEKRNDFYTKQNAHKIHKLLCFYIRAFSGFYNPNCLNDVIVVCALYQHV